MSQVWKEYSVYAAPKGKCHIVRDERVLCGAAGYLYIDKTWVHCGPATSATGIWGWHNVYDEEKCKHCDREWGKL